MRAVIQRVSRASITINGGEPKTIGAGLVILLGIKENDSPDLCKKLAEKCAGLRIFEDEEGKMNLSALDLGLEAMVVSNFTLYGDTKKGKRPSFTTAARPPFSEECYEEFVRQIQTTGFKNLITGEFGADMQIELVNDGPVTLILDTDEWARG